MVEVNTKIMGDLVALFFNAVADAIIIILTAGWTAMEQFVNQLLAVSFGGGIWVLSVVLVFVISGWYVITNYPIE